MQPREREALDWLTLARFLGWEVVVCPADDEYELRIALHRASVVVVGCDPDGLSIAATEEIGARLAAERILVVARAGSSSAPFARLAAASASGGCGDCRRVSWQGPGVASTWAFGQT